MKQQNKQQPSSKVVPFTGEFYPVHDQQPISAGNNLAGHLVIIVAALICGLSLGAILTYNQTDQLALREMQANSRRLEKVRSEVCRQ